ncbi:DUF4231 domain-containing protein [Microbacterium sp. nov. GSS16]|uniref:DUF4231 domain-containing protein n=1 Tax=Microbacterium sp. nov. GSS16 TaxID=3019890 RepID=UPI002305622C|nr:DUF4231 domain-containing protein [Microbacterium sp. nov. GSS16]WCD93085.1 DUF4231 domain-containing protein [Microbacterium sp. nov. GSS16]
MDPLIGNYPALQQSAAAASRDAQRHYLLALRTRLVGLLVAAFGGGLVMSLGSPTVGGWIVLGGFLVAVGSEVWNAIEKADRTWYQGRAAAESAKTLAWRYAVRGESFASSPAADQEFVERVRELLLELGDLLLPSTSTTNQITPAMRAIRGASFNERKQIYREGRVEAQRRWYSDRANANRIAARRWTVALLAFEVLGVLGGTLVVAGVVEVDVLGLLAAAVAAGTAWVQAKQFRTLATAYGLTAQELAAVRDHLDAIESEAEWAMFVGEAEEAISREHTTWRASRGVRLPQEPLGPGT